MLFSSSASILPASYYADKSPSASHTMISLDAVRMNAVFQFRIHPPSIILRRQIPVCFAYDDFSGCCSDECCFPVPHPEYTNYIVNPPLWQQGNTQNANTGTQNTHYLPFRHCIALTQDRLTKRQSAPKHISCLQKRTILWGKCSKSIQN